MVKAATEGILDNKAHTSVFYFLLSQGGKTQLTDVKLTL